MFERVEAWWNEQPTIHYRVDEWPYEGPGETEDDSRGELADDGTAETYELRVAAAAGNIDEVRELLAQKVDVNGADPNANGCTALHSAIFGHHVEIVKLLLEHGADVHAETITGQTTLAVALIKRESKGSSASLDSVEGHEEAQAAVVRLLVDAGADVRHRTKCGWTPLHHAVSFGHVDTAKLLLERGADARASTSRGFTLLHAAAAGGSVELVQLLLDAGASVQATENDFGNTAMHAAASECDCEVVRRLLR
eukprot:CAMPEP_0118939506 /NCGR_PEP_ID=MMETSP1169-20130426/29109_1 /TAXON_ID=36882 /ORGANISM="Pyramimonas obovata, Strain CCMP722" /LENGTH=252 /DNA_ID=CAMNT_0006883797 /DNA_START=735 /DNA_END=1490 /DNA_ORIENTATION=-